MKTPAPTPDIPLEPLSPWRDGHVLNVAAIYEGFAAGIRLQEALVCLGRSLEPVRICHKTWSFSMLQRLDVRAAAIRDAADADILIVVAAGDQALPVQIIRWLERCRVESSHGPAALVELHDDVFDEEDSTIALSTEMVNIADRWQKDLVTNRQFDNWLSADNFRHIIRPESAFDFSSSSSFASHGVTTHSN